jgi:pimeloyl-ACP methyl ester carboxylesterase
MVLESDFFERDGLRLHFWSAGSGDAAIYMVHGSSHCGGVWSPLASKLAAEGYRVVTPDLKGHGLSDKPLTGYAWEILGDDQLALMQHLGLQRVIVIGHSRGGGVSLVTAAGSGGLVKSAIVYEPTVPPHYLLPPEERPAMPVSNRLVENANNRRTVFESRHQLFSRYRDRDTFRHWHDDYLWAYVNHATVEREDGKFELLCPSYVEIQLALQIPLVGPWPAMSAPDMPVTAVFGDRSRLRQNPDPAGFFRPVFPRVESHAMSDASHYGPMEHPDVFERIVRGHLAANPL